MNAATATMTVETTRAFRTFVTCVRANGGSTKVSRSPKSLITAGLVVQVQKGVQGAAGCKARFALTEKGVSLATEMFGE